MDVHVHVYRVCVMEIHLLFILLCFRCGQVLEAETDMQRNTDACPCQYDIPSRTLDCSSHGLETVPHGIPTETERLILSVNNIKSLRNDVFKGLHNLTDLDLRTNIIEWLDTYSFRGLPNLQILDLSRNKLNNSGVPVNVFGPVSGSLASLDIGFNSHCLPWESLKVLRNLTSLTIEGVFNITLPGELVSMTSLKKISFRPCDILVLRNTTFMEVSEVAIERLDFGTQSEISSIETGTFLPLNGSLRSIYTRDNPKMYVNSLLKSLCGLQSLKDVNFEKCGRGKTSLTGPDLYCLSTTCVESLNLNDNKVFFVNFSIFGDKRSAGCLKKLELTANLLSEIKFAFALGQIQVFENLEYLDLSNSQFAISDKANKNNCSHNENKSATPRQVDYYLPSTLRTVNISNMHYSTTIWHIVFYNGTGLRTVDMSSYNFKDCLGYIDGLETVTNLNISGLLCPSLNVSFFRSFKCLKVLSMNKSPILNLSPELFQCLPTLESLDLSENNIGPKLLLDYFKGQSGSLRDLNLANNGFRVFPVTLSVFHSLISLDLRNNRLKDVDQLTREIIDNFVQQNGNFSLKMSGNDIVCLCPTLDFIEWLFTTKATLDSGGVYPCTLDTGESTSTLAVFAGIRQHRLACVSKKWLIISSVSLLTLVVLIALLALLLHHRFTIEMLYYRRFAPTPQPPEDTTDYQFHAYVSCSDDSLKWIQSELIPEMETERNLKLWIRYRDLVPNDALADCLNDGIEKSRKSVFLITPGFLQDSDAGWREWEMKYIRNKAVNLRRNRGILVFFEPFPKDAMFTCLQYYLDNGITLHWTSDIGAVRPNEQIAFWEKLFRAMIE